MDTVTTCGTLVILGLIGSIAAYFYGKTVAMNDAEKRYLKNMFEAYLASQAELLERQNNADKAKDAGAAGHAVTSDGMSDETYKAVFGHSRPDR
jgi:hypothetical protein